MIHINIMDEDDIRRYFEDLNDSLPDEDCGYCPFKKECDRLTEHHVTALCVLLGEDHVNNDTKS